MSDNKVALITGASSGIGRATAELLAREGFQVFGTSRKQQGYPQPGRAQIIQLDVREERSIHAAIETVLHQAGRIDVLVNNAGYTLIGALEETSSDEAKKLFETNFFGVLRMSQAVLPIMRQQSYGRIINVGSVAGFVPVPFQGIYSATKHALEGLSESMDHEVRQFGVRVSVVEPGFMKTGMDKNRQVATHLLDPYTTIRNHVLETNPDNITNGEDPSVVAGVILKAIRSSNPKLRYLAGRQARATNLLLKLAPSAMFDSGLRRRFGLAVTN